MRNLLKLAGIALLLGHACQDAAVLASAPPERTRWTPVEDAQLRQLVAEFGTDNWENVASHMSRMDARQCRDRWRCYLSPSINNRPWSEEEKNLLLQKIDQYGHKFGKIAQFFPGRTYENVRNCLIVMKNREASEQQARPQQRPQQQPLGGIDHTPPDCTGLFNGCEQINWADFSISILD
ncbi:MAG: hypothetical protein LBF72_01780 [Holosporales bacterium]|jgi:hypothetical protein|nr:hypothetical protein [Holosporales bacterium]